MHGAPIPPSSARFWAYSQLEVITARMIGNFVPPNARIVLQLGGTTRDLYYYPKGTKQVGLLCFMAPPR